MQKQLNINLTLATLFTSPSIDALSNLILEKFPDQFKQTKKGIIEHTIIDSLKYVVPIKPTGNRTPFFCVHCVGGNVLNYYGLLPYIDNDQPFYGIQCKGIDGLTMPFDSVQTMAESYIQEIRQIQPKGPYKIGGGSMGGLIAFEMAQQLQKIGEKIDLLLMIDSGCPYYVYRMIKQQKNIAVSHSKKPFLSQIRHSIKCRVDDFVKMVQCKYYLFKKIAIPHELRYWLIEQRNTSLAEGYIPETYDGVITMFRAIQNLDNPDPYRGWKRVAKKEMVIYDFECNHNNMIEHVKIAQKLNSELTGNSSNSN